MISLLIFVVVAGLCFYLLTLLPLPDPFPMILKVIFILICILYLLQFFGVWAGGPFPGRYR